jgi:hypothetical protein
VPVVGTAVAAYNTYHSVREPQPVATKAAVTVDEIEPFMRGAARFNTPALDVDIVFKNMVINPGLPASVGPRYIHKLLSCAANPHYVFGNTIVFTPAGAVFKIYLNTAERLRLDVDSDGNITRYEADKDALSALNTVTELLGGGVLQCEYFHFILVDVVDRRPEAAHARYQSVSVAGDYYEREKRLMGWQLVPPHHGIDPAILTLFQVKQD